MRTRLRVLLSTFVLIGLVATTIAFTVARSAHASSPSPTFSFTTLSLTDGSSEPEIAIDGHGTMAMVSLQWLFDPTVPFGTRLWTGGFGSLITEQGVVDNALQHPGKSIFGAGDADVDIGSTGALHISTLVFLNNPTTRSQLGVSAITCPSVPSSGFSIPPCTAQLIDTVGADRQWVTSDGRHVYISFHDSGRSSLIHVARSDDDGLTFQRVGDPVVGQGGTTGDATFNNVQGKLVADPITHNVYTVYAAGETGILKAKTFTPNHIIVSRSSDMGKSWTANVAFTAPDGTSLGNVFPALAVDPTNGNLYAVWSDGHTVSLASSTDQGNTWSSAVTISSGPATTALFPWVAAYGGTVDVVYYGTTASSNLDPTADWNLFFAQSTGGGFTQTQVTKTPNHHGVICTNGAACTQGTRNLLDLFQVAIDPQNHKAAIIYVDDTQMIPFSSTISNFACPPGPPTPTACPLPQAVVAQQS